MEGSMSNSSFLSPQHLIHPELGSYQTLTPICWQMDVKEFHSASVGEHPGGEFQLIIKNSNSQQGFPGGSGVKNLPANAGMHACGRSCFSHV